MLLFFFSSRRRHTRCLSDWSSDVCSSDLLAENLMNDGQSEAALEQYKVIADANPEDAQTYVRIAEIYRRGGKFDLALERSEERRVGKECRCRWWQSS